jgi:ATP-binding cassette subfamily F protein uup
MQQRAAVQASRGSKAPLATPDKATGKNNAPNPTSKPGAKPAKLSYKESQELAALPARIEALETEQGDLQMTLASPDLYKEKPDKVTAIQQRLTDIETQLSEAYQRWESLDART